MADYYPTLARAVAALQHNDAQARQDLYARARSIVAEQLRGERKGASEAAGEQAALETAIRKIEAAALPPQTRTKGEPRQPARRATASSAQERADNTARSLSKILQAVQPGEANEAEPPAARRKPINKADAVTPAAEPKASGTSEAKTFNAFVELGGAPSSLVTMLFATAYIVAALAVIGVT